MAAPSGGAGAVAGLPSGRATGEPGWLPVAAAAAAAGILWRHFSAIAA